MEQSTKLFLVLGFMFILFTTLNGHLEKYLSVVFKPGSGCNKKVSGGGGFGFNFDTAFKIGKIASATVGVPIP